MIKKYISKALGLLDTIMLSAITFIAEKVEYTLIIQILVVLCAFEFVFSPSISTIAVIVMLGYEYMYTKTVPTDEEKDDESELTEEPNPS